MYFPYLRARQFELIALRELVSEGALKDKIMPILEPVKDSFSNLNLANKLFEENNFKAYFIVNPFQGDKQGDTNFYLNYLKEQNISGYLPAFHYSDNKHFIETKINEYNLSDCLLICLDNFSDEESLKHLCENDNITHIMLLEPNKYRSLDRFIKSLNKFYIRLDDVFEKQPRNAEYLNIQAHKFTEEHLYYKQESYNGFSDFTLIPSQYIDGGMLPMAVVIHLTYLNNEFNKEIWIRHFTSETNDTKSNVQGKFAEAAKKAIQFCNDNSLNNSAIAELRNYYNESRYPGLGTVKKISLKNHLLILSNYLD